MKYKTRQDHRTDEQFEKDIYHWTTKEISIFKLWVDQHNSIRKKIDYIWFPWGNSTNQVFKDSDSKSTLIRYNRPDVLLCKLNDNQREIKWIAPIEVCQTNASFGTLNFIRIKENKIKRYDNITSQIANRDQCILFVAGIEPNEHCLFIGSNTLNDMKNTQTPQPFHGFGDKPAYSIRITAGMKRRTIPLRGDKFRTIAQTTL